MGRRLSLIGKSTLAAILAAIAYGLIHDQITIRICPEYFTVWHPHIVDTENLTLLALCWGVVATWWMGFLLGLPLGCAAALGQKPLLPFRQVLKCLGMILAASGIGAILTGAIAAFSHFEAPIYVMGEQIAAMGADVRHRFTIDLLVHNASYDIAPFATLIYIVWIVRRRTLIASWYEELPPHATCGG